MFDPSDLLTQFSMALTQRVTAAKTAVVAIRLPAGGHLSGMLWRADVIVTSDQSLTKRDEFEVVTAGGCTAGPKVGGGGRGGSNAPAEASQPGSCARARPGHRQGSRPSRAVW